ncbi:MAG: hypothetical protein IJN00_03305, partial [Clostridia bacterium]|nr:hypothetical protein [Clostridia bacterium]
VFPPRISGPRRDLRSAERKQGLPMAGNESPKLHQKKTPSKRGGVFLLLHIAFAYIRGIVSKTSLNVGGENGI